MLLIKIIEFFNLLNEFRMYKNDLIKIMLVFDFLLIRMIQTNKP